MPQAERSQSFSIKDLKCPTTIAQIIKIIKIIIKITIAQIIKNNKNNGEGKQ